MNIDDAIIAAKARIRHYETVKGLFHDMEGQTEYYERQADLFRTLLAEIERLKAENKKQEGQK